MWCTQCNKPLNECTCPDLQERLNTLKGSKYVVCIIVFANVVIRLGSQVITPLFMLGKIRHPR